MYNLYFLSFTALIALFIMSVLLFSMQSYLLATLISNKKLRNAKNLVTEFALILHISGLSLISIITFYNKRYGIVHFSNVNKTLVITGVFALMCFICFIKNKARFFVIVAVFLSISPIFCSVCYAGSIVLLIIRSYFYIKELKFKQKHELSPFSIKEGLDTLPAGIMFCDQNGYIYIENTKMHELLLRFTGKLYKNGLKLWEDLQNGEILDGISQDIDEDVLIRGSSDAFRFKKRGFIADNKTYFEIIAIDVTEIMELMYLLESESEKLLKQTEEITKMNEKMDILRNEREYLNIRSQVHDVLGQRLTAISRMSETSVNFDDLLASLDDIVEQVKEQRQDDYETLFSEIYLYFKKIGLSINLIGEIPLEKDIAFMFLAVLREASTNAIKHAKSTEIYAKVIKNDNNYRIEITNNGEHPKKGLIEGGGLFGIRNRIENAGGTLKVEVIPEFSLIITINRGGK